MPHIDENQIIKKCQKGDLDNFALLYDEYIDKIFRFIYYKTQHKETAEDITSEVFIKAIKSISGFRGSLGTFQAWLFKIARNSVIDYYRSSRHLSGVEISDIWDLGEDDLSLKNLEIKQEAKKVMQQMKSLTPIQREVLILRVWQEMPYEQIAEIVGKDKNNCKVIFSRGIKKLKEASPIALVAFILIKNL